MYTNQLPPWPGQRLIMNAPFKDSFNYFFSAGCQNGIEHLFGQVYQRWGILWRPIHFSIQHTGIIVMALFQLHNFLKDQREPIHFSIQHTGIIVMSLFQLHNFLKDQREALIPDLGSGLGARREAEAVHADGAGEGYDDTYHPSDTCHIEDVNLNHAYQGQCPIQEDITNALEQCGTVWPRPPQQIIL